MRYKIEKIQSVSRFSVLFKAISDQGEDLGMFTTKDDAEKAINNHALLQALLKYFSLRQDQILKDELFRSKKYEFAMSQLYEKGIFIEEPTTTNDVS